MLHIGDILNPHGLKGALTVYSHTRPVQAVAGYLRWYVGETEESAQPFDVTHCHKHKNKVLAQLEGVTSIEKAEQLKGMKVWVPVEDVEIDEDEYLWEDLIGCKVVDQYDAELGTVTNLQDYGAQDIMEVATNADAEVQGSWLIPFVENIIIEVNLENQLIHIEMPDGMDACFTPRF